MIYIDTEGTLRPQRIIENCAVQTLTSKRDSRKYHTILGLQNVSIDLTNIKSVNSQITHSEFKKSQFTYPPQAFDTFIKIAQNNNIFVFQKDIEGSLERKLVRQGDHDSVYIPIYINAQDEKELVWSANMGTKSYGKSFSLGLGLGILSIGPNYHSEFLEASSFK